MKNITQQEAKKMLSSYRKGHFFTVTFTKKDGSNRVMNCRRGVHKGVVGVGLKYNPEQHNLLTVWDAGSREFRMVNMETVSSITMDGRQYQVTKN